MKMIIRIVFLLSCGILVSSNNGYPVMPIQTYPIYQQNGYTSPSANMPGDITPYLQNMMVQNQSPSSNISPINIRQMLLDRILSNQPIQTIFDQNSAGYGSNLIEYPNNAAALNPLNNFANIQHTGANEEDTAVVQADEKRKKGKKRKSSKRRKHRSQKNNNGSSKNEVNDMQENDGEVSKKSKKRTRKPKAEDSSKDSNSKHSEIENNKKTKKKKRKHKNSEVQKSIDEENVDETPKPRRRHKKKPKQDKNTDKTITEEQTSPKPYQLLEGLNLDYFNEGILEENRVPRNPISTANQLLKTIPNLPENIANSFNFKGLPQFTNPAMTSFLGNYENIYQSLMSNNKEINNQREIKRKRPQKSRNSNKRKTEVKNKNATTINEAIISTTSKSKITPKINIVTTEKTIYINEKTRTNVDPIPEKESLKSIEKPSEVNETTFNDFETVDFEAEHDDTENNEPNINDNYSYGYVADYYPQFADSAAYTANKREVYVKNLGDTKYYYAVDKENPDFIKKMRFESFGSTKNATNNDEVNKTYNSAEKETTKDDLKSDLKEEVIEFRSPPHLESPDFETRKVELSEIHPERYNNFDDNDDFDPRFQGDKVSTYSEAKIPHYTRTKEIKKTFKDKPKDVETVFAKSKVVNYGPVYIPEEDSSAGAKSQALTDNNDFNDKGTTYVLATSVDYPDFSW